MKNLFYTLFALGFFAFTINSLAKDLPSCCQVQTNTDKFEKMTQSHDFALAHLNPIPKEETASKGIMTMFKTPDGKEASGYLVKAKDKSNKYVFVFHEWWGLNAYIKEEADKIYDRLGGEVNILALDCYDGKVASKQEDAQALTGSTKRERVESIIKGALDFAGKDAKIATMGWCWGGGYSLVASLVAAEKSKACIIYYGMPEDNIETLKKLNAKVLGIFGTQDGYITPAVVTKFEANMKTAGKSLELHNYDAVHAFANPSNPKYNKEYGDDAMNKSIAFLKANLK